MVLDSRNSFQPQLPLNESEIKNQELKMDKLLMKETLNLRDT